MTTMLEILTTLAVFAGALALGFIIGAQTGYKRGRDEQWIDSFIQRNNRERERRDKIGRFKTKTK
jgi:ABC-type dipeptide/oligopeptide/nickel transport system permease subunit